MSDDKLDIIMTANTNSEYVNITHITLFFLDVHAIRFAFVLSHAYTPISVNEEVKGWDIQKIGLNVSSGQKREINNLKEPIALSIIH